MEWIWAEFDSDGGYPNWREERLNSRKLDVMSIVQTDFILYNFPVLDLTKLGRS